VTGPLPSPASVNSTLSLQVTTCSCTWTRLISASPEALRSLVDPAGGYGTGLTLTAGWRDGWQHYRLADYLCHRAPYRWILSYDNEPACLLIRDSTRQTVWSRQWPVCRIGGLANVWCTDAIRFLAGSAAKTSSEILLTTLPPSGIPVDERSWH